MANETLQFNIHRINALAKIIVTISLLLGLLNLITHMIKEGESPYFYGYLILYGTLVAMNLFCIYYFARHKMTDKNRKNYVRIVEGYINLTIILGALIAYYDIYYHGHLMMFTFIYFLCCMLFIVPPLHILPSVIIAGVILLIGLTRVSTTPYINANFIIFAISILVFGMIAQIILTRTQRVSLEQRIQLIDEGLKSKNLAEQLVIANDELRRVALYDYLTGLPNRHAFSQYLEHVFADGKKKECSVFILDIDYFKQYNDFYGHEQGDEAVKKVAMALEQIGYNNDFYTVRWGGEEFLGMSVATDTQVDRFCQQILEAVELLHIEHYHSAIGPYLTVSVGIYSTTANSVDAFKLLYTKADQALYAAKENGRNGYIVYDDNLIING